jgi:hypothetical protein
MSRQPPHADLSALLLKLPGARLARPPRYGPLLTMLVGRCMLGACLPQDCTCRPGVGNVSHPFQRGTCTEHQQGIACCTSHCVHAYENTVQHRRPTGCQPPPQAAWPQEINLSLTMHLRQPPLPRSAVQVLAADLLVRGSCCHAGTGCACQGGQAPPPAAAPAANSAVPRIHGQRRRSPGRARITKPLQPSGPSAMRRAEGRRGGIHAAPALPPRHGATPLPRTAGRRRHTSHGRQQRRRQRLAAAATSRLRGLACFVCVRGLAHERV